MKPEKEDDHDSDCEKIITTLSTESGIKKDIIKENIDKIHPLGKPDKEGRQLRIVKFISDSFKETITDDTSTALKPMLPIRGRRNWLLELTSNSNHLSPAKD